MIFIDEGVKITVTGFNVTKSGQYMYRVHLVGETEPSFDGYCYLKQGQSAKTFDITDIVKSNAILYAKYRVTITINDNTYSNEETVANINRYPNRKSRMESPFNNSSKSGVCPMLQGIHFNDVYGVSTLTRFVSSSNTHFTCEASVNGQAATVEYTGTYKANTIGASLVYGSNSYGFSNQGSIQYGDDPRIMTYTLTTTAGEFLKNDKSISIMLISNTRKLGLVTIKFDESKYKAQINSLKIDTVIECSFTVSANIDPTDYLMLSTTSSIKYNKGYMELIPEYPAGANTKNISYSLVYLNNNTNVKKLVIGNVSMFLPSYVADSTYTYISTMYSLTSHTSGKPDSIVLTDAGNEVMTVGHINWEPHTKYYLKWRDRYGSYQCQPFCKTDTYTESIEKYEYTTYDGERNVYGVDIKPSWKVNSGWIDQYLYPYFESIYVSDYIELYDVEEDKSYKVILKDTDYTEKTSRNQSRSLFNLQLTLELNKNQNIIY